MAVLRHVLGWLRSPRLALGLIAFLAAWCGVGAWASFARGSAPAPGWAAATGLDRPFSSWPFLAGNALLFASTAACALPRWRRCLAASRGALPPGAAPFPARPGQDLESFLRARGFARRGDALVRWRAGFWGGWILHLGLLGLLASVAVQQLFHDEGLFRLASGEAVSLDQPGVVFGRERGPLAPESPPAVEATLAAFDPFQRQAGYVIDRRSRLGLRSRAGRLTATLDRAAGVTFEGIDFFQAIPTGLALRLEWPDGRYTVLDLLEAGEHRSVVGVDDPMLGRGTFVAESERDVHDQAGTGRLSVRFETAEGARLVSDAAPFGPTGARLARVDRWGEYKYSRDPGLPGVLASFLLLLAGSALLAVPAGVARLGGEGEPWAGLVFVQRGGEALRSDWEGAASVEGDGEE
ncbi:cytochrome c biogenesis protein ResB [Anaeromyxobacter paludicola]|uniref:ResB-like domain-containing protein n=1 Tax=Anaeromyxobacter paludicola TaxID=2918171 RepID=A0ABN6N333_9BACT|nr:cytochrome c biogenesis protein ResB [Anaeromyxobacter paludicola]BDG07366.1 hypothetical protein AMPC_04790 [Anaeromyxobacter paludicola]